MPAAARVAPAWRPGAGFEVAYVDTSGRVTVYDALAGSVLFRTARLEMPTSLDWSPHDRLLVVTSDGIDVYGPHGQRVRRERLAGVTAATFSPDGRRIAVLRPSELRIVDVSGGRARRVFAGAGPFSGLAWSPDGRWLLVGWPSADQWVFIRADGRRIRAVSDVSAQFRSESFPRIGGWCCG
jgi:dipeptidyl aminopeptidase/acylaminoacyl peptidase